MDNKNFIQNKIQEMLKSSDNVPLNISLKDIGLDSMDIMKLIIELEIFYEISINDDDLIMENFSTIRKIELMISKYLEESALEL